MQHLLLVYIDQDLLGQLSEAEYDADMRHCLHKADTMKAGGSLLNSQQLEPASTARSVRRRGERTTIVDGPSAETKEMLAGFNLIGAPSLEAAVRIAQEFPRARYGCIEVRPVRDLAAVRAGVGA